MGRAVDNPPPHAAHYLASQEAKKRARGGAGGDRNWRSRGGNSSLGGRGDGTQALAQRPPTPPVELWDYEIEEQKKAASTPTAPPTPTSTPTDKPSEEEEEEENWDTASEEELSWDNLATPPTDYSNVPSPEEEEEGLAAAEASLPTKDDDEGI